MDKGDHRSLGGLEEIRSITLKMNNRKKKKVEQKRIIVETNFIENSDAIIDIDFNGI